MGPLPGIALLYRILALPSTPSMPLWMGLWGAGSLFWCGLMGWSLKGRPSLLWAGHAMLIGILTGASMYGSAPLLGMSVAIWLTCGTLLVLARGYDPAAFIWSWPAWLAVIFLLGVPPSPIGTVLGLLHAALPWPARGLLLLGCITAGAALLQGMIRPRQGSITPPWIWQYISWSAGLLLILALLFATTLLAPHTPFAWLNLGLWLMGVSGASALARWGWRSHQWLQRAQPLLEIIDMQWFYRSIWRGTEHLLSVLRISAEVLEGSGAILWSLLLLLLVLLIGINQ